MQQMKSKRHTQPVTTPAPVTNTAPVENKQEKTDTTTPPMKWNAHAWRTASIKRCINRGVFCFKQIAENTGIPEEHVLPIYIDMKPDEPTKGNTQSRKYDILIQLGSENNVPHNTAREQDKTHRHLLNPPKRKETPCQPKNVL